MWLNIFKPFFNYIFSEIFKESILYRKRLGGEISVAENLHHEKF